MEIIIVLGNSNPIIMKKRVERSITEFKRTSYEYYDHFSREYKANKLLLFTGGLSDNMKEYALSQNIDKKFIVTENKSRNTIQNMVETKKLLREMFTDSVIFSPKLTICTSSFHIRSSIIISKFYLAEYILNYIHTDEHVTDIVRTLGDTLTIRFINNILSSY
jgi:uncharacterized SAM-binding protein YcdF (DUF218 family)